MYPETAANHKESGMRVLSPLTFQTRTWIFMSYFLLGLTLG